MNASFSITVMLIVTFGCSAVNASAIACQFGLARVGVLDVPPVDGDRLAAAGRCRRLSVGAAAAVSSAGAACRPQPTRRVVIVVAAGGGDREAGAATSATLGAWCMFWSCRFPLGVVLLAWSVASLGRSMKVSSDGGSEHGS